MTQVAPWLGRPATLPDQAAEIRQDRSLFRHHGRGAVLYFVLTGTSTTLKRCSRDRSSYRGDFHSPRSEWRFRVDDAICRAPLSTPDIEQSVKAYPRTSVYSRGEPVRPVWKDLGRWRALVNHTIHRPHRWSILLCDFSYFCGADFKGNQKRSNRRVNSPAG